MSSMSSPYTGKREWLPSERMKWMASFRGRLPSSSTTFFRWVITSSACLSPSSKMLVIISASLASSTPCSWPSLTMDMMSSSVTLPSLVKRSMPAIFKNTKLTPVIRAVRGEQITARMSMGPDTALAQVSGSRSAHRLGITMPRDVRMMM